MGVIKSYQVNGAVSTQVGGVGTAIKYFPNVPAAPGWLSSNANVNAAVTSNNLPFTPSATSNAGGLQVPGNAELNGQLFTARASGNILFGAGEASTTGKVGMYLSNALPSAAPNYQTLLEVTLTNQGLDNVYYPWAIEILFEGDTLSGVLTVFKSGASHINGVFPAAAGGTSISGINFTSGPISPNGPVFPNGPAFTLVTGVTWGASNAGNLANLYQFQVSLP